MKGYIHQLESFGCADGPGSRFIVFTTGCRLRCKYCHNPDTWDLMKGKQMETDEILAEALACKSYWGKKGGITVSGGEPLVQIDFLIELFEKAKEKGIPVISYDRLIPDSDAVSYFVSFNHYAGGRLVGEYVAEALDLKNADSQTVYHIEFMSGDLADTNSGFFFNGTYDVLKTYLDAGNLAVPSEAQTFVETATAGWSSAAAGSRMNDLLEQYYGGETALDAVICADDTLALGVDQAIEENYQGKNTVIVTGQGGDEENLAKIIDGSQSATVFLPTADEAEVTLALGKSLLEGVFPDSSLIEENSWAFHCTYDTQSYDNGAGVAASYLLDPVVITAENMQKELIDTGYYVMEEDLPKAAQDYVLMIEEGAGCFVKYVSVGPERESIITRRGL